MATATPSAAVAAAAAAAVGMGGPVVLSPVLGRYPGARADRPAGRKVDSAFGRCGSCGAAAAASRNNGLSALKQRSSAMTTIAAASGSGGSGIGVVVSQLPDAHPPNRFLRRVKDNGLSKDWDAFQIGKQEVVDEIAALVEKHPVIVFSKTTDPLCKKVTQLFYDIRVDPFIVELDLREDEEQAIKSLFRITRKFTVPHTFVGGKFYGSYDDLKTLKESGKLEQLVEFASNKQPA